MIRKKFRFNNKLNTKEGKRFIYKAVNFFVVRSIKKAKDNSSRVIEQEHVKRLYDKYKFIYERSSDPDMELCYLLVQVASEYIDWIEDGFKSKFSFPFDYDVLFDLESWFDEIDTKNLYTEEIMVLLINRLYNTVYRELILV